MKPSLLLPVAAGLLLAACGQKADNSAPSTNAPPATTPPQTTNTSADGGSVLTAPVDYLAAAARAQQSAVKTVDVAAVNQAIQMFNVQEGRYPKDLNELVEKKYMPKLPPVPYGM